MIQRQGFRQVLNHFRCLSSEVPKLPACDFVPQQYSGRDYDQVLKLKRQHVVPCINALYKRPLLLHQGHMQWLFDHEGRRYLDMFGGIVTVSVGHCHPKVTDALSKQQNKLWHTSNLYLNSSYYEYAEMLAQKMPGELKVVYLVNSGSEANDLAVLLARLHTGNYDVISLRNCYHGMSCQTMSLTAQSTWRYNVPGSGGIHHAMNPDPYRGIWGGKHCRDSIIQADRPCDCGVGKCEASDKYYDQLEEVFKYSLPKGKVAAMFAESIQGVGGTVQFASGYIKKAQELVRANGGLFVSDEVQTGFGRTGDHFWGFEAHRIVPDIVTMAKGIGNGFPMAAVVTTPKIAECLSSALHFNTFGGNYLACAVGKAVLEVIEEEKTQQLSKDIGTYLLKQLSSLKLKWPIIGDVRGKGLMIGVELIHEDNKSPLGAPHMVNLIEHCKEMGLLIGKGGMNGNVLRIKPPMCITKEDVDFTVAVIERALQNFTENMKVSRPSYEFLNKALS